MACAWLAEALDDEPACRRRSRPRSTPAPGARSPGSRASGFSAPLTTSAGRLFDAVAALCGLRARVNYEGQAAIELEAACDPAERRRLRDPPSTPTLILDPRPAIRAVADDVARGRRRSARSPHAFTAASPAPRPAPAPIAARRHDLDRVVLSGGVFPNRVLLAPHHAALERAGLRVLLPSTLPAGDGAIAYGQAAVAATAA